jgi:hypothetical protein
MTVSEMNLAYLVTLRFTTSGKSKITVASKNSLTKFRLLGDHNHEQLTLSRIFEMNIFALDTSVIISGGTNIHLK